MILSILISIFNILSVYYASKNNRLTWLFGIVAAALTPIILNDAGFIWQIYFQIFTVLFSCYAFITWKPIEADNDKDVHISNVLTSIIVMFVVIGCVVLCISSPMDNKDIDLSLSLQCIFATYLLYKKNVMSWVCWIIIDMCFMVVGAVDDNIEIFITYLVLFILAVRGFLINYEIALKNDANNIDEDYILNFLIKK